MQDQRCVKFNLVWCALCCVVGIGSGVLAAPAAGAGNARGVACGPGAIAILTEAIGAPLDNATLGTMVDADGGTTLHAMSEIVRSRGLHAAAFETDVQGLMELGCPAILQVDLQGSSAAEDEAPPQFHFVAFLGASNSHEVLLADPIPGSSLHGLVSRSELDRYWTGRGLAVHLSQTDLPPQLRSARARSFELGVVVTAWILPPLVALMAWRSRRWGAKTVG